MMREIKEFQKQMAVIFQHIQDAEGKEPDMSAILQEIDELMGSIQKFIQGASSETAAANRERDEWQSKYYMVLEEFREDVDMDRITIKDHKDILVACIQACESGRNYD